MPRCIGTCFRFYKQMPRNIGTCFRFYTQMRVEKTHKAFAYRIYSHFTQQCCTFPFLPKNISTKCIWCNRDFFRIFGLKSSITLSVTFASIEQIWIPFPHFSVAALNIPSRRQNKDTGSKWLNQNKYTQQSLNANKDNWSIKKVFSIWLSESAG